MKDEECSCLGRRYANPKIPEGTKEHQYDVLVVGGGVTGITVAYLLKKAGSTVALIERERVASIDTGHTTAHLTYVTDVECNSWYATLAKIMHKRPGMQAQPRSMKLKGSSKKNGSTANLRACRLICMRK